MLYVDKVTHFDMIMMFHMTMTTGKVPPPRQKSKNFSLQFVAMKTCQTHY